MFAYKLSVNLNTYNSKIKFLRILFTQKISYGLLILSLH